MENILIFIFRILSEFKKIEKLKQAANQVKEKEKKKNVRKSTKSNV